MFEGTQTLAVTATVASARARAFKLLKYQPSVPWNQVFSLLRDGGSPEVLKTSSDWLINAQSEADMYCPICSAIVSSNQKFCRTCGFGLEKTVLSVSEQLPTALDENVRDKKNRLERLGVAALSIFGTGVSGLLLYQVGYKLMLSQGKIMAGLGIMAFIVIIGSGLLSVILFAKANEVQEESGKGRLQKPEEFN